MHTIHTKQVLTASINEVWKFISSPQNLQKITPPNMDFKILNNENLGKMYEGQIIEYQVKPVMKIPLIWITEITHVREPFYFVDEQRFGPYRFWHHKHFLREHEDGTVMEDLVHYSLPFGLFGRLLNRVFVRKQLDEIFQHRFDRMEALFGADSKHQSDIEANSLSTY